MPGKLSDKQILKILRYDVSRAYIGDFVSADLHNAVRRIKTSRDWDHPLTSVDVRVGNINRDTICDALWYEMSYNPGRFGTVSPFLANGRNSLYHFCRSQDNLNCPDVARDVLESVRYTLVGYMMFNAHPNGQWRDNIPEQTVTVGVKSNGHTDNAYKKLAKLRDCVKIIASQNVADFHKQGGAYRTAIIDTVNSRHPNGIRPQNKNAPGGYTSPADYPYIYDNDDRLDDTLDSLQITLDNQKYISPQAYAQACDEYELLIAQRYDNARTR